VPSTLTVSNTLDSGAGSLRAEIVAAKKGDTIVFSPIVFNPSLGCQTIALTSGELLIDENLTIAGPGAGELTISGSGTSRVFEVAKTARLVTLSGLTISNGVAPSGEGGGIENYGTLTVSGCTLSGNSAAPAGGGIYNHVSGTLTVSGSSTLSGNSASEGGGIGNDGTLTVTDSSTLSGNTAEDLGGGINNDGRVTVSGGSILSNNSAGNGGGGIVSGGTGSTLTVIDSTLSGNATGVVGSGGGIFNFGSLLTVSDSTLSDNSAYYGGGISTAFPGTASVSGSTLSGNSAYRGGGIYVYGSTLTVSDSTLTANSATSEGGGIFNKLYGTVTVENSSTIIGNFAPVGFGADVYNLGVLHLDSSSKIGALNV